MDLPGSGLEHDAEVDSQDTVNEAEMTNNGVPPTRTVVWIDDKDQ